MHFLPFCAIIAALYVSCVGAVPASARGDSTPSTHDLLASCPIPGLQARDNDPIEAADRCVWYLKKSAGHIHPVRQYFVDGNHVQGFKANCNPGAKTDSVLVVNGSTTFHQTYSVPNLAMDLAPYSIGFSHDIGDFSHGRHVENLRLVVPPGKKGAIVAVQNRRLFSGTISVNYPERVYGHYLWYVPNVMADLLVGTIGTDNILLDCNAPEPQIPQIGRWNVPSLASP